MFLIFRVNISDAILLHIEIRAQVSRQEEHDHCTNLKL